MKNRLFSATLALPFAFIPLSNSLFAQRRTPEELAQRAVERRAVEAVIWGMPAVNYDLMRQTMLKVTEAKENDVLYWSRPADGKNQTLTPNPDSIYFMVFWNTKATGPLVIDVPPAEGGSFAGNIVNTWQMPLEDAGPDGADKGKGGKYLLLPPDYKGDKPEGYFVLPADTYTGFALLRSNLKSHEDADIAAAVAYGKRVKVYPLAQAANPAPTKFVDANGILFDSTIRYDASFFENLHRIVQDEPWLSRDKAMIDPLKTLGIEKGKPFQLTADTTKTLTAAAGEAKALLAKRYDEGFYRMNPDIRWFPAAMPEVIKAVAGGYADPNEYPVDARGVTYTLGFTGIKRIGTAQFYLMVAKDKAGQDFDGSKSYRLTVPPNAPVKNYWSVTAYDRETHALIRNMKSASRASISSGLQKNADGSVSVYFGPTAPAGKEGNWVPTDSKGKFELLFRLYGPEKAFFDKEWELPDVEEIK
jgi:hypothetical protein